jgi:hypothetical protein
MMAAADRADVCVIASHCLGDPGSAPFWIGAVERRDTRAQPFSRYFVRLSRQGICSKRGIRVDLRHASVV